MKWIPQNRSYRIYIFVLALVNLVPIWAPIFLKLGETSGVFASLAKWIYFIYSFTCHQFAYRSFHLFDYQYAWCARDVGIWLAILVGAIVIARAPENKIRWYWLPIFILPIALDGGIQTIATLLQTNGSGLVGDPVYMSSNFTRFFTGAWFGLGLSLWLSPLVLEIGTAITPAQFLSSAKKKWKTLLKLFPAFVAIFAIILFTWYLTSPRNLPAGLFAQLPGYEKQGFYQRRQDAVCPAGIDDFLALDCFR